MFKLESYITPIILNHVAKYVKNIRNEDSQVSLWEGEVSFQNLDLRLDVLEEELNLPFEFLSGHVHELSILVPWMKITSEPIKITINTIEFVLKLKDANAGDRVNSSPKKTERRSRVSKVDDGTQQQQGYMPGLVNKIINNIDITCHNIILKYVEEDIVVSMNIQLLSFSSADESWKPAFTEIHPLRVFMRKLVQVSDLTICLDKRNAAGQIDVCQEPILYRCSLEMRIVRKYNLNTFHLGSITRIAIFTKLMEMNVSSLQFPMAMRLFKLLLALKNGDLKSRSTTNVQCDENDVQECAATSSDSYLNWAWNLIPRFSLTDTEEEETVEEEISGQLLDIGIYVEALNFTLKSSEFITDSIVGATKKIRYSPIVKVILGGIYSETVIISDKNWSNTKSGCSSIAIEPLGSYKDDESEVISLVTTQQKTTKGYLDRSLFDHTFVEKDWNVSTIENYNARVTEDYLLYRSPTMAFDLVQYEEESTNEEESSTKSEENNVRIVYRILASSVTLRYNQSYSRIAAVLKDLIATYDYPPYVGDKIDANSGSPKLHPPLLEDYDSLMIGIPLRIYKFNLSAINIEFHPKTEPFNCKTAKKLPLALRKNLPFFRLSIGNVDGEWSIPLDIDKLVHTTCQLPEKPIELVNACYSNAQVRFKNVNLKLQQQSESSRILSIPKGNISYGDLLQPTLWKIDQVPLRKIHVALDSFVAEFSKSDLILVLRLWNTINVYDSQMIQKIPMSSLSADVKSAKIRSQFKKIHIELKKLSTITMYRGSLKLLQSFVVHPNQTDNGYSKSNLLSTTSGGRRNKWLEWYLQIPNDWTGGVNIKSVMALWIEDYSLLVNENLVDFLQFMEGESLISLQKEPTSDANPSTTVPRPIIVKQSSMRSLNSERPTPRKISVPEETIHVSSERDDKANVQTNRDNELLEEFSYSKIIPFIRSVILKIQIAKGSIRIASTSKQDKSTSIANYTEIKLPQCLFSSASAEHIDRFNVHNEFKTHNSKPPKDTFPWTCNISNFAIRSSLAGNIQEIIHPIQTSITIAMTHRKENLSKPEKQLQQQKSQNQKSDSAYKSEAEKTKLNVSLLTTPESARGFDPNHVGSFSPNGRSQSFDEQNSSASEKRKSFLQETVENVFMSAIRKAQSQTKDIVAISLHIDTSPIHVEFASERIQLIRDHLTFVSKALGFLKTSSTNTCTREKDEIQIVTPAEENATIKKFLEMDTNSDTSMVSIERVSSKLMISYLVQWTITKLTAELDASKTSKCKLVLDMEDLISSVDKQEDFTKLSNKVGTLNMRFFELKAENEFVLSDRLRVKMLNDSVNPAPFFSLIITTVGVKNFFKKIGAKRKEPDQCRAISEVIVKMEEIEIIADVDKVGVLAPVLKELTGGENSTIIKKTKTESPQVYAPSSPCTVSQLPMVHIDSKGFTVYIPTEEQPTFCSVAIFKTSFIKISPNLENPLQRCPMRADVYQKAAQMGTLSTPGSIIEDRQYELTFGSISTATGNWNEILNHMKEHTDNFRNTNPAFEWNNQSRKNSLELKTIFKNINFVITYAPCITYNNILVCGQAIEFNCVNDLVADLHMDQVSLFCCIVIKLENILRPSVNPTAAVVNKSKVFASSSNISLPVTKKKSMEFKPITVCHSADNLDSYLQREEIFEKPVTDSGISSGKRSSSKKLIKQPSVSSLTVSITATAQTSTTCPKCMPYTVSFVAGIFFITLYNYSRTDKSDSIVEKLTPLLTLHINQPSFLLSQSIFEVTKRYSLFDFDLDIYHPQDEEPDTFKTINEKGNESDTIFDSKPGKSDQSGIPSPLFILKSHTTKSKKQEIDISICRNTTLRLSEPSIKRFTEYMVLFYETLLKNACFNARSEKSIFRGTKIQILKSMFLEADRLSLKIDLLSLEFWKEFKYNIKLSLADFRLTTRFLNRPEKMNIKGSMGGFYVESNRTMVIHPIGVKFNIDLVQENWNRLPLVTASFKFNVIQCDVGPETVSKCLVAMEGYRASMVVSNDLWEGFLRRQSANGVETNRERLQKINLPEVEPKKATELKEEFYQDDLRAGAFQFVEMVADTFLPMPYQIQIIKKNYGIICWRYPQPRKMAKIHIFPVPMAVPNPIRIKCRMEYYSEAHESFLHYCDFWLSETVSLSIKLPEREITANIWRVVIQQSLVSVNRECFDTSEEDEELRSIISIGIDDILNAAQKETDFILHPKVLVGCMRIDTIFRPCTIPKFQLLVNMNEIKINLQTHQLHDCKLSTELKKYKLSESCKPHNQIFTQIGFEKTSIHASFHTLSNYSIHSELTFGVKSLDHGYLNLISIIEPTELSAYLRINNGIETSIVADRISLNVGPSVLHNLISAKQNWEQYFNEENTHLISKYIVVNRTCCSILFGQTHTNEKLLLNPKECCKYSFKNVAFGQELTFYFFDGKDEFTSKSVQIPLDFPATTESIVKPVPFVDKCLLLRTRKLSATQYYILLKGQIELISMVNESFMMELYRDDKKAKSSEIHVEEKGRLTILQRVTADSNISIRLKIIGEKGKGQTGNIPLKSNKSFPWLVKVPVNGPEKFISYWIRIIREPILELTTDTYHPEKILICIWPIFEVRSMMTCPMTAIESCTSHQFTIPAEGKKHALLVPATHQTDHRLTFIDEFKTTPEFNLTLKAIDWNKFFWYDENVWTVDKSIAELSIPTVINWPMNDEEELRIRRQTMECKATDVLYKCCKSREFSCTLTLEVAPWGTFINATGHKISVQNANSTVSTTVDSNKIGMLPIIKTEFFLSIQNDVDRSWWTSLPIIFDKIVDTAKRKCYCLNENESLDIVILGREQVYKFYLTFRTENERNIFVLKPKYVIANMTSQALVVSSFCLDHKECTSRNRIEQLAKENGNLVSTGTTTEYSIGMCLDGFHDINGQKSSRTADSAFVFFVCVRTSSASSDISIPIALMNPFNRKCFSVQQNEESFPLSATLIEKKGQFFLSIFDDSSPMILFNNQTNLTIVVGQTTSSENSKVSNTVPEYDGKHWEWYQISRPKSCMYYTPPTSYANFPDVENSVCNISIAMYNEKMTKKTLKWSKAVKTNASWEKFLHIPAHGDVKVIVCDKHRIIRISVFYIAQQLEFSVKDLRSRLLTPQSTNDSPENTKTNAQESEDINAILENESLQRLKPTPSQCLHESCDPSSSSMSTCSPLKILLSVNEINLKIFVDCKTVDYLQKEIFALYIDDFLISYNNIKRTLNLQLTNLQIDNQLFSSGNYDFPVILCSQELYKGPVFVNRCEKEEHTTPMAEATIVFYDDELRVSSVACRLSPIRAYIEDTYLNEVLDYLVEWSPANVITNPDSSSFYVHLAEGEFLIPKDIVAKSVYISEPMKMQNFRIEPMNVLLSVHTCVRLYIALDHSPLHFSAYERQDILTLPLRFGHAVGMHYLSGALFGAGWVVGSLEMLGSPSGLARSFSSGLRDFVSMPVQGLLRGPWGFVVGVTQGSASLLRNITAGTVNSVSKLAASVSRNLDRLTLDPEHIQRTEALRRCRPQGFTEGFTQGITGLGISMLGAVGGIARHTLEARSTSEVVTGMGKGIVGAIAKPISGAAELLALTGQGVLQTVGFNTMPHQRSPSVPRTIAMQSSEQKVWYLLLQNCVLGNDEILFFNEVTLIVDEKLFPGSVLLTSTILALVDTKNNKPTFVNPLKCLELSVDANDKTLLNICVKKQLQDTEEDPSYTNQRILSFLQTSGHHIGVTGITSEMFDDTFKNDSLHNSCSFYLSEHLGQYLIEYLKIINIISNSSYPPKT